MMHDSIVKTALVTGASSGIGAATARRLAGEGHNVVLTARRRDRLEDLAHELGDSALPIPTDVTDPDACAGLVERAIEYFGTLDVLVNNAGVGLYDPIAEADPADWRRMFDVNVLGVLHVTQAAVRHMIARRTGHVVFVSSVAGRRVPHPHGAVYAATKHAITAISEGLRLDMDGQGVRVTNVEPGLVRTEFPTSSYTDADEYYAQKDYAPLEAEDVATAVAYAVGLPPSVSINEILLRPSKQPN
jgi:NADP-dependent 3-hydroxy acid dehydrogenase YdfG